MSLSFGDRLAVAHAALGRSVIAINPHAEEDVLHKRSGYRTVGLKDTAAIPKWLIEALLESEDHLVLTVDKMSDLGRSVDTELVNPLTYRCMTGSSSGGAINVLKGINDICVGTDGGGSVLAPALATNLYAVMGQGVGLATNGGVSTDNMPFKTGIGFIGNSFAAVHEMLVFALRAKGDASESCTGVSGIMPDAAGIAADIRNLEVAIPKRGTAAAPDGSDMGKRCHEALSLLGGCQPQIIETGFDDIYERMSTVKNLRMLWEENPDLLVMDVEGPIDVFAYDETIPRGFAGSAPEHVAGMRSKALCKAINIAGGSAVVIPSSELATGILVACGPGEKRLQNAFEVAYLLDERRMLPSYLSRYFLDRTKAHKPLAIFG